MKRRAFAVVLVLLACAAARAQGGQVEVVDQYLTIIFAPPPGFKQMGADSFPKLSDPGSNLRAVFGDPRKAMLSVTTFNAAPNGVKEGDRESLKQKLEADVAASFPDVKWVSRDVVPTGGPSWLRLRYTVVGPFVNVVTEAYAIVWFGKVVVVTFYSPEPEYEALRPAFEKSAASLRLVVAATPVQEEKPARRRGRRKP